MKKKLYEMNLDELHKEKKSERGFVLFMGLFTTFVGLAGIIFFYLDYFATSIYFLLISIIGYLSVIAAGLANKTLDIMIYLKEHEK